MGNDRYSDKSKLLNNMKLFNEYFLFKINACLTILRIVLIKNMFEK